MPWGTIIGPEELDEADGGGAGNGDWMAAGVLLLPRETIQFYFERTDTPTEPWGAEIFASLDDSDYGGNPIASHRWEATQIKGALVITGPQYVKVRILNVDATPTDVVVVEVSYAKDQVNL